MSARNEAPYVDQAVASILAQRFQDFEFVIRDDGSTDSTGDILDRWAERDHRIRLCRAPASLGLAGAGNFIVAQARAPLVARMDADDIADPQWLGRLYATIEQRPRTVLVGCLWSGITAKGEPIRVADRWRARRRTIFPPFAHGSSIFRRDAFERAGGYRAECTFWEDCDLVLQLARQGEILFLPEVLYRYRFATSSTRLVSQRSVVEAAVDTSFACVAEYRRCGDYEAVLDSVRDHSRRSPRATPRTHLALSWNQIWNGLSPGRLGQAVRAPWPLSADTLASLLLLIWAELAPRSLRFSLAGLFRLRSLGQAAPTVNPVPVIWDPRDAIRGEPQAAQLATNAFALVAASCYPPAMDRRGSVQRAARTPVDPEALVRLTSWLRIAPFVQRTLSETGMTLPAEQSKAIDVMARRARARSIANAGEEARLAEAARRVGLDLLFLKGATLAHLLYDNPIDKTAWDIDVLIAPRDMASARALLEQSGYRLCPPAGIVAGRVMDRWLARSHESLWVNAARQTAVELHTGLVENPSLLRGLGIASPRQHVAIAQASVATLADEHLFAYLTVHGAAHGFARLKWLADIAMLIERSARSLDDLHAAAVALGAGRCPGAAIILCARLFGTRMSPVLADALAADRPTRRLVDDCWRRMDRVGDPERHLDARSVAEILRAMRLQYRLIGGLHNHVRTFWSQWTRPYTSSQSRIPSFLLPVVMIGWLPARLILRPWRRAAPGRLSSSAS